MIATYPTHRIDSESAALGIHLIVYCAVGAGLAFGLYALLQPSRTPNSGLAIYKPPPAAVVTYAKRSTATTGGGADCAGRAADCRSRTGNDRSLDARTRTKADDYGATLPYRQAA